MDMGFLKNWLLKLTATGPAAVVVILLVCITALGIWGNGPLADRAMTVLSFLGSTITALLLIRGWK